jgi:hypothetical protein
MWPGLCRGNETNLNIVSRKASGSLKENCFPGAQEIGEAGRSWQFVWWQSAWVESLDRATLRIRNLATEVFSLAWAAITDRREGGGFW